MITAAILVIGNEILSGRTKDTNINFIAQRLSDLGIDLLEVRIVPDDEHQIIEAVNALRASYTYVFTTGGIGATHDDITAATIAKAFQVDLIENPMALAILKDYYQERFNNIRRRMALMPRGASLVDNPVSKAPAFQMENVFCLAGMPSVMQGMFEALTPQLETAEPFYQNIVTCNLAEGVIGQRLTEIQTEYPTVNIGSYPFYQLPNVGVNLVVRGKDKKAISNATDAIIGMVKDFGGAISQEA
ncbi:competence/damage-inducible protein A [Candidatus Finniella inopinata]|uniref:Competence/damage-inducible protein A n=1 Tax=Candidatus Finniella inopinata TaxID=1696036 RepID=A0A4Q7DIB7_9PROT|nr:molybdopterin-binding protein [Candidatus Finniella inopinata]RZI46533.1 competence/damage-inducible protein A [Candidatus Finniella inopinata]